MNKIYTPCLLLCFLLVCSGGLPLKAQSIIIGQQSTAASNQYGPYYVNAANPNFVYSRYAYLYTATELGIPTGAIITSVYWNKKNNGTLAGNNTFSILLANNTASALIPGTSWDTLSSGATQVYSSTTQQFTGGANSWEGANLTFTFTYTGGSLLILTDFANNGIASKGNNFYSNSALGMSLGAVGNSPLSGATTLGTTYGDSRPTIEITYVFNTPCSTPPTAGSLTSASSIVCVGDSIHFSLSGNSYGIGQTYQLESSSSGSGSWTSIGTPSATVPDFAIAQSSSYYRMAVSCSGFTSYSDSVFVQVNGSGTLPSGTFTVNAGAPSSASNFQNFTTAMQALSCGISGPVTINVVPGSGPYNERVEIPFIPNASSINTITINGNGESLVYTAANPTERTTLTLNGSRHIIIDSLEVVAAGSNWGFAVLFTNGASNNTIRKSHILADSVHTTTEFAALVMSGSTNAALTNVSNCDSNIIEDNIIDGGYYGVTLMTTSGNQLLRNEIRNFYYYGVYVNITNNLTFKENDLHRENRSVVFGFYGVYQNGNTANNLYEKNRFHDPFRLMPGSMSPAFPFLFNNSSAYSGSETKVINNLVYNVVGGGTLYGFYNSGTNYIKYYHNTIIFDDQTYLGGTAARGMMQLGSSTNIEMKNNLFYITRSGTGTNHGIYKQSAATVTADYNIYYINGNGPNYVAFNGYNLASLANWQANSGEDSNSAASDPMFVDPFTSDYSIGNPALDNIGTYVGVSEDINGVARDTVTPDIGAFEYNIPVCSGTPVAGTVVEQNNTTDACLNQPLSFSLSGYSVGVGNQISWQSSPQGLGVWNTIPGATTPQFTTTFTGATDYRAVVTCTNGGASDMSNVISISQQPFYFCYCSPSTGNPLYTTAVNSITNVAIPGTALNYSTIAAGPGGFLRTDPSLPYATAGLISFTNYTLTVTIVNASVAVHAWVDFDRDGFYDTSEYIPMVSSGTTATGTFAIPLWASSGQTGLRVRSFSNSAFGPQDACSFAAGGPGGGGPVGGVNGEVEDYVVTISNVPLSVYLKHFTGENIGDQHKLSWEVENNNNRELSFDLERSGWGNHFEVLSTIVGQAGQSRFSFLDRDPLPGKSYYRLKMRDVNGAVHYSNMVTLTKKEAAFTAHIWPNPASGSAVLQLSNMPEGNAVLSVFSLQGKLVKKVMVTDQTTVISLESLPAGTYFVEYVDDQHVYRTPVVKK